MRFPLRSKTLLLINFLFFNMCLSLPMRLFSGDSWNSIPNIFFCHSNIFQEGMVREACQLQCACTMIKEMNFWFLDKHLLRRYLTASPTPPQLRYKFLSKGRRGGEMLRTKYFCVTIFRSSYQHMRPAHIAFEGTHNEYDLCDVFKPKMLSLRKPNDFRFINLGIKSRIYCTRKEFRRRPKSLLKSASSTRLMWNPSAIQWGERNIISSHHVARWKKKIQYALPLP